MKKIALFAFLTMFFATACKKDGAQVHKKGDGPSPKIGDMVYFDFSLKKDTAEIFNTAQTGRQAQELITDPAKIKDPFYKFLMQSIISMRKGDSSTFTMKIDTMKTPPQGLSGGKVAYLTIALKDVMSEDDYKKTLSPEQQKMFDVEKKRMALQERLETIRPQFEEYQKKLSESAPAFIGRVKAVGDSTVALAKDFAAGKLPANVQTTASGLQYVILKEGSGPVAEGGKLAFVNYYGCTKTGQKHFDDSYSRGNPFVFAVGIGEVIPAWDEALALFKEGTTAVIFVPSKLGYGEKGAGESIPANSDLVFYIELLKAM